AYGPQGIHVAHVVVDGGIAGDKIVKGLPQFAEAMGEDGLVSLGGLADAYWFLYTQPRAAWTHELDLRTFKESFRARRRRRSAWWRAPAPGRGRHSAGDSRRAGTASRCSPGMRSGSAPWSARSPAAAATPST